MLLIIWSGGPNIPISNLKIKKILWDCCSDILETASLIGKYLSSFIIDSGEVESLHSLKESDLTGNETSLIFHNHVIL